MIYFAGYIFIGSVFSFLSLSKSKSRLAEAEIGEFGTGMLFIGLTLLWPVAAFFLSIALFGRLVMFAIK